MATIKIKTVPISFHCEGMMRIIRQLLREKVGARMKDADLDMYLTEYAKFWYYKNVKHWEGVDCKGREVKA